MVALASIPKLLFPNTGWFPSLASMLLSFCLLPSCPTPSLSFYLLPSLSFRVIWADKKKGHMFCIKLQIDLRPIFMATTKAGQFWRLRCVLQTARACLAPKSSNWAEVKTCLDHPPHSWSLQHVFYNILP